MTEKEIAHFEELYWQRYEDFKNLSFSVAVQVLDGILDKNHGFNDKAAEQFLSLAPLVFIESMACVLKDLSIKTKKDLGIGNAGIPFAEFQAVARKDQKMPGINE